MSASPEANRDASSASSKATVLTLAQGSRAVSLALGVAGSAADVAQSDPMPCLRSRPGFGSARRGRNRYTATAVVGPTPVFAGITTRRADMNAQKNLGRSLGLAAAATLAAGLVGAVPADASPAVASVTVADNTLIVAGTNGPDRVIVDFTNPDSVGIDIDGDRQSVGRRTFTAVSVRLRSGDDRFSVVSGGS